MGGEDLYALPLQLQLVLTAPAVVAVAPDAPDIQIGELLAQPRRVPAVVAQVQHRVGGVAQHEAAHGFQVPMGIGKDGQKHKRHLPHIE